MIDGPNSIEEYEEYRGFSGLGANLVELPQEDPELAQVMKDLGWTVRSRKPIDHSSVESKAEDRNSEPSQTESIGNPIRAALHHLPHPKFFGF